MPPETTRVQLDVLKSRLEELDDLMSVTGIETRKDLINNALVFFEWAVSEKKTGRIVASIDEATQKYKEIVMPALEHAARRRQVPELVEV